MGLEKYVDRSKIMKHFYSTFVENSKIGNRFKIKLVGDDEWYEGVPTTYEYCEANPIKSQKFYFESSGTTYSIPIVNLDEIKVID